jgi:hypothetical protein
MSGEEDDVVGSMSTGKGEALLSRLLSLSLVLCGGMAGRQSGAGAFAANRQARHRRRHPKPGAPRSALKKRWAPAAGRDMAEPLGNNCAVEGAPSKPRVDCGG